MSRVCAFLSLIGALLAFPLAVQAQIKPGEYVFGAGYGDLRITVGKGGAFNFRLNALGANFHICELSGVIRNGESRMDDSANDKLPCIVTFTPQQDGIVVASKHERACSVYCGARAHFEGTYALPPAGCEPTHVANTRRRFKAAYDGKRYAEARTLLTPIHEKCSKIINDLDQGWVSNDLAITQYRNGDSASCRNILQPWLELAQTPDATIKSDYPPSDADARLRIAHATRANMKLCGAAVAIGGKPK